MSYLTVVNKLQESNENHYTRKEVSKEEKRMNKSGIKESGHVSVDKFVMTAIEVLRDGQDGIHAVESGLNGALSIYYGNETHPATWTRNMMQEGKILTRLAKGGVLLYNVDHVPSHLKVDCLIPVQVKVNTTSKKDRHKKRARAANTMLSSLLNWSETGRLCGGKMIFTQSIQKKCPLTKKGVYIHGFHHNAVKVAVNTDGDDRCFEYFFTPPTGVKKIHLMNSLEFLVKNQDVVFKPYQIPPYFLPAAQLALARILEAVEKEDRKAVLVGLEVNEEVTKLTSDSIKMILSRVAKKHNLEKIIPRTDFTAILQEVLLGGKTAKAGRLSGYVRQLSNHKPPIIMSLRRGKNSHITEGYMLTEEARNIFKGSDSKGVAQIQETLVSQTDERSTEDIFGKLSFLTQKSKELSESQSKNSAELKSLEVQLEEAREVEREICAKIMINNKEIAEHSQLPEVQALLQLVNQ